MPPTLLHLRERRHRKATGCASQTCCPRGCADGAVSPRGVLVPAVPSESPPPRRGTGLCADPALPPLFAGVDLAHRAAPLTLGCGFGGRAHRGAGRCRVLSPAGLPGAQLSCARLPTPSSFGTADCLGWVVLPTLAAGGARAHRWGSGPWGSFSTFRHTRAVVSDARHASPSSAPGPESGSWSGLCQNTCPWAGRASCGLGDVQEAAGLEPWGLRLAGLLGCCLGSSRKGGRGGGPEPAGLGCQERVLGLGVAGKAAGIARSGQ